VADKKNSDLVSETDPNDEAIDVDTSEPSVDPSSGERTPAADEETHLEDGDSSETGGPTAAVQNETVEASTTTGEPTNDVTHVVEKRGGFGMAFIGGVAAAGLGFFAGQAQLLDPILPDSLRSVAATDLIALENNHAELIAALAQLQEQVETNKTPDLSAVMVQIDALSAQIAPLSSNWTAANDRLDTLFGDAAALSTRLSDLEKRPISEGASPAAVAAYEAELAKLQESLVTQREEVQKMVTEAQALDAASAESARVASAQTMVARLRSSLDAGTAYGSILNDLESVGVTVPTALAASADQGVAALAALSNDFVPAARAALAAAREDNAESGGLLAYAQRHLGARSVTPRQGDDPDAVLSRAEAAIATGRLDQALDEIQSLPDTARTVLLDWETAAKTRQAAVAAADALAESLNAN